MPLPAHLASSSLSPLDRTSLQTPPNAPERSPLIARSHAGRIRSVAAAQEAATQAWRQDLRSLLTRAEERFADVCWTTALPDDDNESDAGSVSDTDSTNRRVLADWNFGDRSKAGYQSGETTIIWAHKAILYARAPNTFQARYLKLRSPAAQLGYNASTASLVSLPALSIEGVPQPSSRCATPTSVAPPASVATRKSVRGSKPPSSFSMKRPSLRRPSSRNSVKASGPDDTISLTSGVMTSDSEPEGLTLIRTTTRSQTAESTAPASRLSRVPSFTSDAESTSRAETASILSEASTIRAPMSLNGVSQAYFEATLEYLYTGEQSMVDAFEFLYEDRVATDAEKGPAEKQEKLRSDLTFMWRSKLYSDVKIVLDAGEEKRSRDIDRIMPQIPDANVSTLSLPQTIDTERVDESDVEDDELTSFSSHRMILASRSPYFASLLLSPYSDSQSPVLNLPSPPFTTASLHFALGFLYTGTLFFSNRTFDLTTAFQLWRAGAYLQVETLQHLIASLIAQDFCHNFSCSPPCRKCLKRVPRTLAFASSVDVSDADLAGMAMSAITGPNFGLYWGKEVGNLHPTLRNDIVNLISEKVESRPPQIISVLRQLSIVGRRIDTERASKWVDALRSTSERIEARLLLVIGTRFEEIIKSPEWADLIDGVGQLGDILEKSLVMLADSLTEARAAQVYQLLVGQVLLREEGFEIVRSKQAIEDARGGILRYLKRRWINVRALGGFNGLEKWCLSELAHELGVAATDLELPKEPLKPEPPKNRTGLRAAVTGAGSSPTRTPASPLQRRTGPLPGAGAAKPTSPRSSAPATSSRLRTLSTGSTSSARSATSGSPNANRAEAEAEREPGPINLRAAVLNRNAARTSATNGHRSAVEALVNGSPATQAAASTARSGVVSPRSSPAASPAAPSPSRSRTASGAGTTSSRVGSVRSRAPAAPATTPAASSTPLRSRPSGASLASNKTSTSSLRGATSAAAASARAGSSKVQAKTGSPSSASPARSESPSSCRTGTNASTAPTESRSSSPPKKDAAAGLKSPAQSGIRTGSASARTSSELLPTAVARTVRTTKSAVALRTTSRLTASASPAPSPGTKTSRPASSLDKVSPNSSPSPSVAAVAASAAAAVAASQEAKARLIPKTGASVSSASASSPAKHAYLKATPRPGGIFSLSSTDSGKDLRTRTLSAGGRPLKSVTSTQAAAKPSTTATTKRAVGGVRSAAAARTAASGSAANSRAGSTESQSRVNGTVATTVRMGSGVTPAKTAASSAAVSQAKRGDVIPISASEGSETREADTFNADVDTVQPNEGEPEAKEEETEAVLPDDASASTAYEMAIDDAASGTDIDSDAAETARSGSDTASDTEQEFDPDETITGFPPGEGPAHGGGDDKTAMVTSVPGSWRQTIAKLGGTSLFNGIPCIVSSHPHHHKAGRTASSRFHAMIKYMGPVLGYPGDWIGIEVALPLPKCLMAHDGDEAQPEGGVDLSPYPGGLHDGQIDGMRYFDLTLEWDLAPPSSQALAAAPYSPNLGSEPESYLGFPFYTAGVNVARRGATTPVPGAPPAPTKRRYRHPENPERRARRRRILQLVHGDPNFSLAEDDDQGGGKEGCEASLEEDTSEASRGLFVRPRDIVWVPDSR
ncbi:hypothetical protein ACQY0O_001690 [Thecaphora frezii]